MIALGDLTAADLRLALSDAKALAASVGDDDLVRRLDACRFALMSNEQAEREHAMRARLEASA